MQRTTAAGKLRTSQRPEYFNLPRQMEVSIMVAVKEFSWEVFYAAVPLDDGKELGDRLPYILLQQWGV